MLNEKLEQEARNLAKTRLKFALTAIGLILIAGLVLSNLTPYQELTEFEQRTDVSVVVPENQPLPLYPKPEVEEALSITEQGISEDEDLQPSETVETPTITQLPNTAKTDTPERVLQPVPGDDAGREEFKAKIKRFEDELFPQIVRKEFMAWNAEAQKNISTMRNDAVVSFSLGDYDAANRLLDQTYDLAKTELNAREAAFEQAMHAAVAANIADDYDAASLQIASALRLHPSSRDALMLRDEVERLPAILKLLDSARIAKIENSPKTEIAYLNQALVLDPSRVELEERVKALTREIKERKFVRRVAAGLEDVSRRDLDSAVTNLSIAKLLYPDRQEVKMLAADVSVLSKDLELESALREAKISGDSDDWPRALGLFAQAKAMQPVNQAAVNGYALAQTIITARDTLSKFLLAPQRLSSSNVSAIARQAVEQARMVEKYSPSLVSMAGRLIQEITLYETKVPIQVISDGLTSVAVRGIGRVGVVTSKIINLKPGRYAFEGKRTGYQSVLIWLEVLPEQSGLVISIVCNEQV